MPRAYNKPEFGPCAPVAAALLTDWGGTWRLTRLIFSVPLLAHIARPIPHRPSQFSRPAFFYRSFFWALLQANSCVRQLRGFCFPGSALTPFGFPPIKQPFALEAEAIAFGCPRKMGQKKETFSCPTYVYILICI